MTELNKADIKSPWIIKGYEIFGIEGPKGLQIERLSRKVNKSKSSFYHHFAEIDIFIDELLKYHLKRAKSIQEDEKRCKRVIPDLIELLISYKIDLLFNRQLRINRNIPKFKKCYEDTSKESVSSIIEIWSEFLGIESNLRINQLVLALTIENFYLHITEENMTYNWLENYIISLKEKIKFSLIQ